MNRASVGMNLPTVASTTQEALWLWGKPAVFTGTEKSELSWKEFYQNNFNLLFALPAPKIQLQDRAALKTASI